MVRPWLNWNFELFSLSKYMKIHLKQKGTYQHDIIISIMYILLTVPLVISGTLNTYDKLLKTGKNSFTGFILM